MLSTILGGFFGFCLGTILAFIFTPSLENALDDERANFNPRKELK